MFSKRIKSIKDSSPINNNLKTEQEMKKKSFEINATLKESLWTNFILSNIIINLIFQLDFIYNIVSFHKM